MRSKAHPNTAPDSLAQLRQMTPEALLELGQDSLRQRLLEQATLAHQKHAPLTPANLEALLADPACTRYPTRLVFEFGEMARHQFADIDLDYDCPEEDRRVLFLRPNLRDRPDLAALAVAYMLPVINYGDVINDELCRLFGATLLGLMEEEFYRQICALADFAGCAPAPADGSHRATVFVLNTAGYQQI